MRMFLFTMMAIVIFTSCGSGKIDYAWQGEAKGYLDKYQEMMFQGDTFQAAYYLQDAIKQAQKDTSLKTLATVFLTQCAMEKAMGKETQCHAYSDLEKVYNKPQLHAYKTMLLGHHVKNPKLLGKYQGFYEALQKKAVTLSDISSLDTIYAQAIAAKLAFESGLHTKKMMNFMINQASKENLHGLMLLWLTIAKNASEGEEKKVLEHKIRLLSPKP